MSGQRQKNRPEQGGLAFPVEGSESLAGTERLREEVCELENCKQALPRVRANKGKSARYVLWEPGAGNRSWPPGGGGATRPPMPIPPLRGSLWARDFARAIARQQRMHFPPNASQVQPDALPTEGRALLLRMVPLGGRQANSCLQLTICALQLPIGAKMPIDESCCSS